MTEGTTGFLCGQLRGLSLEESNTQWTSGSKMNTVEQGPWR